MTLQESKQQTKIFTYMILISLDLIQYMYITSTRRERLWVYEDCIDFDLVHYKVSELTILAFVINMRDSTEEVAREILKGFKVIMDDAVDKFLNDFRNDLKVIREKGNDGFDQRCCEELDESSLIAGFAEPKGGQVSTTIVSTMVEFKDSLLEPPLVQSEASTENIETEQELLILLENYSIKNLLELPQDKGLLKDESTMGLLEQPQEKFIIFEVCGGLAKGLLGWSPLQSVTLGLPMVAREVHSVLVQMFDGRFVSKFNDPAIAKSIFELVENDDTYGFSCDPFIHEDIEPTNVLFDFEYRAKISDFGLLRIKVEGEYGVNLFCQGFRNQKLWKSHELYGIFEGTASAETPAIGTHIGSNNTEILVDSLIENSVLELLVQNLQHLLDKDPDDISVIYNTLASIENMIEVKHAVAELVCERTKLLRWLLAKIKVREFDSNKQYASEILSILLQNSSANQKRLGQMNGVDMFCRLWLCINQRIPRHQMKRKCWRICLLMPFKIKEMFVKAEGVELMIIIMEQKKSTYASAIRALDFSMTKLPCAFMGKIPISKKNKERYQEELEERISHVHRHLFESTGLNMKGRLRVSEEIPSCMRQYPFETVKDKQTKQQLIFEERIQMLESVNLKVDHLEKPSIHLMSFNGSLTINLFVVLAELKGAMENIWWNHLKKAKMTKVNQGPTSMEIFGLILEVKDCFEEGTKLKTMSFILVFNLCYLVLLKHSRFVIFGLKRRIVGCEDFIDGMN
ncbi:hypothetical protein GQ457_06G017150 [Hibiscus cannabinus]